MTKLPSYVLITPARNEARLIERTIQSVVAQTLRPLKWVIVSDGSTDGTDQIVKYYTELHPWIELVRMPKRLERHFAGKVHAFNAGYERLRGLDYQVVGNLDGDTSFDDGYFAFLMARFAEDPGLGIAGARLVDTSGETYDYRFVSKQHVSGPCQLFRKECFEQIGGYVPSKFGCIDSIAVIGARMKGWTTHAFMDVVCYHHRPMGQAQAGALGAGFRQGVKDYMIGNHPLWQVARTLHQLRRRPYVLAGLAVGAGYLWSLLRRVARPVSPELVHFHRQEQIGRLRCFLTRGNTTPLGTSTCAPRFAAR